MADDLIPRPDHTDHSRQNADTQNCLRRQDKIFDSIRAVRKRFDTEVERSGVSPKHESHLVQCLSNGVRELKSICHVSSAGSRR